MVVICIRCILFLIFIYLFIYLWLCLVLASVRGLSPVAASGGHSSSRCAGPSLPRPLPLRSTGSRRAGSATVAHGPSCSAACGILPDQGSNPCPPHWQADSQPPRHQGSPAGGFLTTAPPGKSLVFLKSSYETVHIILDNFHCEKVLCYSEAKSDFHIFHPVLF